MSRWVEQTLTRHPEERAQRASQDDGPSIAKSSFEGRATRGHLRMTAVLAAVLLGCATPAFAESAKPHHYNIGTPTTPAEIAGWNIDIRPDGQGAPPGHGSVKEGEKVYMDKCAACHGEFGESAGRWPQLAQGKGTLASDNPVKTVGSYFPYLSSVFDYVRRAMPFGDAESLTNDELYAVVAYVLNLNDIVDDKFVLSKETWAKVKMPNANGFYRDDRATAEKAFWNKNPCMKDCRPPVKITGHALAIGVTPDDKGKKSGVE